MSHELDRLYLDWRTRTERENHKFGTNLINLKILNYSSLTKDFYSKKMRSKETNCHLVFSHIFKTAGTSLIKIIGKNYRVQSTLHVNGPVINTNYNLLDKGGVMPRVIVGHFNTSDFVYQALNRKHIINLIIFRDPLERVVSYYKHIKSRKRHKLHEKVKDMSLHTFVKNNVTNDLWDGQCRWITGNIHSGLSLEEESIKKSLNNYSIIGSLEQFNVFIITCALLLGWKNYYYRVQNKSKYSLEKAVPTETKSLIYSKNEKDYFLFDKVNSIIKQQGQSIHLNDSCLKAYEQFNFEHRSFLKRTDKEIMRTIGTIR